MHTNTHQKSVKDTINTQKLAQNLLHNIGKLLQLHSSVARAQKTPKTLVMSQKCDNNQEKTVNAYLYTSISCQSHYKHKRNGTLPVLWYTKATTSKWHTAAST